MALEEFETQAQADKYLQERLIEQQREISRLREANRWIPVAERLPEEGQLVQVLNLYSLPEYEPVSIGMIYQPTDKRRKPYWKWVAYNCISGESFQHADWICPGGEYVTHWRPLPKAPEGVGSDAD